MKNCITSREIKGLFDVAMCNSIISFIHGNVHTTFKKKTVVTYQTPFKGKVLTRTKHECVKCVKLATLIKLIERLTTTRGNASILAHKKDYVIEVLNDYHTD